MPLKPDQLKKVLKEPKNKSIITDAQSHERRLRFHSKISLSQSEAGQAVTEFLGWVKTLIPSDKYRLFKSFFRFPAKTVNTTAKIYDDLEKIFDGRDPVYRYQFLSDDDSADWSKYRREKLNEPHVWKTKGFDAMKNAINSILVVDLPEKQGAGMPEPYFYFLDISQVIDFEINGNGFDWIIFKQSDDQLAVFDDTSFRLFKIKDGVINFDKLELITENAHNLGFCPARFFWETPIDYNQTALKKSPITSQLSNLDTLLRKIIDREHLENYAAYPIIVTFEEDCDFESVIDENHLHCDGGYLKTVDDVYYTSRGGSLTQCPKCGVNKLSGAGTNIQVPPPDDENGNTNLIDAAKIIGVDRSSLDYNTEEVKRLSELIHSSVTGYDGELLKNQAINEKQVIAGFEGRSNILRSVKHNFEMAQQWTTETICKLRYGDSFQSASISYGQEFYLYNADFILSLYEKAKTANLSSKILDLLEDQYFETKFKNNPEQLERNKILCHLDPFRHLTIQEVKDMYEKNQIAYSDYMIKANFSTYIMRFEREEINIVQFGEALNFDIKINRIFETLKMYVPANIAAGAA